MLIAGSTGSGKSVFFKQAVTALVEKTDHLQVYLLDLKGGVEMNDFSLAPNVRVICDLSEAVITLKKINDEMKRRFALLRQNGHQAIDPDRDELDRIIIGIDEASVLFSRGSRYDRDFAQIEKARELVENISKLSRAAGISLILATQKVTKETIDTRIQENLSGKMCFKMNTTEGSVRMLGVGDARNLSDNPGRGLWQVGNKMHEVQVPYIDSDAIKLRMKAVKRDFDLKVKSLFKPMIGEKGKDKKALSFANRAPLEMDNAGTPA